MALNAQEYRDALAVIGPDQPVFIEPSPAFREWLTKKGLPNDVVRFLLETAVASNVPFFPCGDGGMWPPTDIVDLNDQESDILARGLLALGNAYNGDFIVIDLQNDQHQAGFVSHGELWEEFFVPVAESLDEMLVSMGSGLFPQDYSEALCWKNKQSSRAQAEPDAAPDPEGG